MAKRKSIGLDLSSFEQQVVGNLVKGQVEPPKARKPSVQFADPFFVAAETQKPLTKADQKAHAEAVSRENPLVKSVLNVLNGSGDSIERLAFESQPWAQNTYGALWRRKLKLLPDDVLKRISIQDDLVAAIVNTRSNQLAAFGRPQPDRFSTGFKLEPEPGHTNNMTAEEKQKLQDRIAEAEAKILTCGSTKGWQDTEKLGFGQFLFMSARNAVVFGRIQTEILFIDTPAGRKFHSFRPIDAGTVYRAAPFKESADAVRREALHLLSQMKNKKLVPEKFAADEYSWVQVIDGRPVQAFTAEECVVHNFYPTTDVELDGYPMTPLDTVITAVTTHINIGTHNKLYFQSGRAARGMIVIQSDDVDEGVVAHIRQQFNANINSVGNAWRMPIFGVGTEDQISWQPIDNSSRDMEFQYLSDTNARVILSAFQMSPEELPGYAHLSRGTNNQALSESNTEYKLEAARDVGIRPLIGGFQNFINSTILPLVAPDLAEFCHFKFVGLDVDTAEKESVRLQQDLGVHMTMDEVLERVEKDPVGKRWGGRIPLNPQWSQQALSPYLMVGDILEHFFGIEGAAKDPRFQYVRDPFWFQNVQLQMQMQQMQQEAQAQQMQAQQAQQQPQEGQEGQEEEGDLSRSVDQLGQTLGKSDLLTKAEQQLPNSKRRLLVHQRKTVEALLHGLETDAQEAVRGIIGVAEHHVPAKLKKK